MNETEPVVTALAEFATKYREDVFDSVADELGVARSGLPDRDARTALKFFYRLYGFNRSEAMEAGYQHRAVEAVRKTGTAEAIDPTAVWRQFERGCERSGIGPYERRNRKLLIETSQFANRKGNVFRWVARELENGVRLRRLSDELQSLHGIGPKKARFFLRDAVWLCGAEPDVTGGDRRELQPVTGPIKSLAKELWPTLESEEEIAQRIVEACADADVSGIEFNQGAWYVQDRGARNRDPLEGKRPQPDGG